MEGRRQRPLRPGRPRPTPALPAAPAPAATAEPLPAAPADPLTQSVRSGETAAGAWEQTAPAGVGLRRRVSPGTLGPWEPGTRKRREAEVGEGWRRAHALASCPAAGGSPFRRDSSYFQSRRKVPGSHPSSSRPAGLLRALPAAAAVARTLGSARSAPLAAPRPRAQTRCRNTRGLPATHTCCSRTTPTQRACTLFHTPCITLLPTCYSPNMAVLSSPGHCLCCSR